MNTRITTAYKVTSALVSSAFIIAMMPASSAYASSVNLSAPRYGYEKKQVTEKAEPTVQTAGTVEIPTQPQTPVAAPSAITTSAPQATTTKKQSPSGNNGFIKVNEEAVSDNIPNNDPHVSCTFKVEFYNYDYNPTYRARVGFALQNPTVGEGYSLKTEGNTNVTIGNDAARGGNDLDAIETYRLTFTGKPHAKQGYHVKLTIHADGSHGADIKHKVFWVQPCADNDSSGHVLGESTAATLPNKLPSTGGNAWIGLAVTSISSILAYVLTFRFQKLFQKI